MSINEETDLFHNLTNGISEDIKRYSILLENYNNIYDLYINYKSENENLTNELINTDADVNTNNRKTYYESQQIDYLNYIYKNVLIVIYIIVVIAFAVTAGISSSYDWKIKVAMVVFLIIYPFISTRLLGGVVWLANTIYGAFPKNVYANL